MVYGVNHEPVPAGKFAARCQLRVTPKPSYKPVWATQARFVGFGPPLCYLVRRNSPMPIQYCLPSVGSTGLLLPGNFKEFLGSPLCGRQGEAREDVDREDVDRGAREEHARGVLGLVIENGQYIQAAKSNTITTQIVRCHK